MKLVKETISEYLFGKSLAGVVTDNTGSVRNARETPARELGLVVSSQDQAHVADRLMGDIGNISWTCEVIQTVSLIGRTLRRCRKLRAKVLEIVSELNKAVRERKKDPGTARPQTDTTLESPRESLDANEGLRLAESRIDGRGGVGAGEQSMGAGQWRSAQRAEEESSSKSREDNSDDGSGLTNNSLCSSGNLDYECPQRTASVEGLLSANVQSAVRMLGSTEEEHEIPDAYVGQLNINLSADLISMAGDVPRFARTLKKVFTVRFASCEKLLDEYISLHPVLKNLLGHENVEQYCNVVTMREKEDCAKFCNTIRDDGLVRRVRQVLQIMRACRIYLRVFESETCLLSEVLMATNMLESILKKLPPGHFPEPKVEN